MSQYTEKIEEMVLPMIYVRGLVLYPGAMATLNIPKDPFNSVGACEIALEKETPVFIAFPNEISAALTPTDNISEFCDVGLLARVKQISKAKDGQARVSVEGLSRAVLMSIKSVGGVCLAEVVNKMYVLSDNGGIRGEALMSAALGRLGKMIAHHPTGSDELMSHARSMREPGNLADFIAANVLIRYNDKIEVLKCFEPMKRGELIVSIMESEIEIVECETKIQKKTKERIGKGQRDFYLREQLRVIREELGDTGDDADDFSEKIRKAGLPENVEKKLLKEADKLSRTPFGSAESTVLTNYLETCLEIPWGVKTKDRVDIAGAKKILDADHDGIEKVKERILEFLAVKQLNPEIKNQIICLVGPPGVGKTSVCASVAKALKRKYVRVSLGGVRDEADIRGHRKTYVAAMPGRIITGLIEAGSSNPLMLLDEIDKMSHDAHGDPSSAMLEVLDSEQNKSFRDHFVEMPFDLSDCIFIATANSLDTVPRPLIDRMEIIEMKTYTKTEKMSIAKNHLIPKQLKRHGMNKRCFKLTDGALSDIIDFYTREAGVRNLERKIGELCRKAAVMLVEGEKCVTVDEKKLEIMLGAKKMIPDRISDSDEVGEVNGLAWTEVGGDMLKVETVVPEGSGKLELTGSLGDVMKESAKAAISYVRVVADKYGIDKDFYKTRDIHIHVPEGAVPKDGPSAGVTMTTALVSALSGIPVRRDVAMTGEITLRGKVLAIGGLKEKSMAAYSSGVKTVLIPFDNMKDLDEIDSAVREKLEFIPCKTAEDVLSHALVR